MHTPLVTVVIPTIKPRRGLLLRAVNSVLAQDLGGYGKPAIEIAIDREHDGAAVTRNRALDKVQTPWVAFLDDDDYFLPNHLQTLIDATCPERDVIYSECRVIGPNYETLDISSTLRHGLPFDAEALRRDNYIPVTSLVRTELAQVARFGPPDHDPTSLYEDWGFYLRLLKEGGNFHPIPEVTWVWHHHGRQTQGQGDNW